MILEITGKNSFRMISKDTGNIYNIFQYYFGNYVDYSIEVFSYNEEVYYLDDEFNKIYYPFYSFFSIERAQKVVEKYDKLLILK